MDPNANLKEQRELVQAIYALEWDRAGATYEAATRLAELVEAMDSWLSRGGDLPTDWRV